MSCYRYKYDSRCVVFCPSDTYAQNKTCMHCHNECQGSCEGPDPTQCTKYALLLRLIHADCIYIGASTRNLAQRVSQTVRNLPTIASVALRCCTFFVSSTQANALLVSSNVKQAALVPLLQTVKGVSAKRSRMLRQENAWRAALWGPMSRICSVRSVQ